MLLNITEALTKMQAKIFNALNFIEIIRMNFSGTEIVKTMT